MRPRIPIVLCMGLCLHYLAGCANSRPTQTEAQLGFTPPSRSKAKPDSVELAGYSCDSTIRQVNYRDAENAGMEGWRANGIEELAPPSVFVVEESLNSLVDTALAQNPRLIRLFQQHQAAAARSQYVDKLPDPRLGANVFGNPIETASGSQRATLNLSQAIPWLGKLNAEQQRAFFEVCWSSDFCA